ncbi:MAG: dienelactone hydrolase family protein [Planctomycetota bacterium]
MIQDLSQHSTFARQSLPGLFLADAKRFRELLQQHGDRLLAQLWADAGKRTGAESSTARPQHRVLERGGIEIVVVELPSSERPSDPVLIVLTRESEGPERVFVLERNPDAATGTRTRVLEREKQGIKTLGVGPNPDPNSFVSYVEKRLRQEAAGSTRATDAQAPSLQDQNAGRKSRSRGASSKDARLTERRRASSQLGQLSADDIEVGEAEEPEAARRRRRPQRRVAPSRGGRKPSRRIWPWAVALVLIVVVCIPIAVIWNWSTSLPALPEGRLLADDVRLREVKLKLGLRRFKVWIYTPEGSVASAQNGKRPVVLVGPAGTPLIHGMKLGDGDRPEHLPYVRAGSVVVAYEIGGAVKQNPSDYELGQACFAFKRADAGAKNAKLALDYVLSELPGIDEDRIYSAGHSSAATLALVVAAKDSRIDACVAYAPEVNVPKALGPTFKALSDADRSFGRFLVNFSPHTLASKIQQPTFLFYAEDDTTISTSELRSFATKLEERGQPNVVTVRRGGHYDPMIKEGIPQAIRWLEGL